MISSIPPAQLWIGQQQQLYDAASLEMQKMFCTLEAQKNDLATLKECFCPACRKIKQHTHPSIVWIVPEKNYLAEDLEVIFGNVAFKLDEDTHFFFILGRAHTLTRTCANRLLKVLEEPPRGFHFILLANNASTLLPTISSRCILRQFTPDQSLNVHELLTFFLEEHKLHDPIGFERELRKHALSDSLSIELFHELYGVISQQFIKDSQLPDQAGRDQLETTLAVLNSTMRVLPHSGSATIFWKNLYLSFPRA